MKKAVLLRFAIGATLASAFFIPSLASADSSFPSCDNIDLNTSSGTVGNDYIAPCTTLGASGTLFGIELNIAASSAGQKWANVQDGFSGTLACVSVGTLTGSESGLTTFTFASPVSFTSSQRPRVALAGDSGCSTSSGIVPYFAHAIGGATFHYGNLLWSPAAPPNVHTRIDSVAPFDGALVATSTAGTVSISGFVNSADLSSSTVARLSITKDQDQQLAVASPSLLSQVFEFPVSSSGAFSFSTSTANFSRTGQYTMKSELSNPYFSFFGFDFGSTQIVATTTVFVVGTTTAFDRFQNASVVAVQNVFDTFATSTCALSLSSFNLGDCVLSVIIPNSHAFDAYAKLPAIAETRFPFSYVAGVASVWSGLSASTTENAPVFEYKLHDLGLGSTTPIGNILPNVVVFSASTTKQYFPPGVFDALKALASIAILLGLLYDIFFTTRNLIHT